ncbi:sigma-54 interaction domain-containing protein [Thermodesulforhabdus norvegica]|uniref:PAS domain S-box-containing protein n=1 Tax=Thermodesulforhabdus norvegica TaxID=39841 RepID=A0A1I4UB51_9BACT|nr:sigma 54-interacting transcriptional regulator [Thermodesulforhabdus norvegica]SFM86192.1 PAS domain S-box-containing protein [Thermodesulforhabdus norvegica]
MDVLVAEVHDRLHGFIGWFLETHFFIIVSRKNLISGVIVKDSVKKFRNAATISSGVALYITDGNAITLGTNRAYERLTGLQTSDLVGKHMRELVEEGFFDRSVSLLVLDKGDRETISQSIIPTGRQVIVTGNPVFTKDGKLSLIVTTVEGLKEGSYERASSEHFTMPLLSGTGTIVAASQLMREVIERALLAAGFDSTVLIVGETGVGKEVVARLIHERSARKSGPFVRVNLAAIPRELFEAEMFGYRPGAFTGASRYGKEGLIVSAEGGTVFLDEVGELPADLQVKLLRVLQEKEVLPVGATEARKVDVRFIAATNRPLDEMVERGDFRMDLYFRLNVLRIDIPPLRDRPRDVAILAQHFLQELRMRYNIDKALSPDAVRVMLGYSWPGNVRELQNLIERLCILTRERVISAQDVMRELGSGADEDSEPRVFSFQQAVEEFEKKLIKQALHQSGGNLEKAAHCLGMHRTTLWRKLKKYGLMGNCPSEENL